MAHLSDLVQAWNTFYQIEDFGPDRAFQRFLPAAYDSIGYDWKTAFEPDFVHLFNGLKIRGAEEVRTIFLAVFPTEHVLERFLAESEPGDLLYMHHPILMECGDPRGEWGRGFVPIPPDLLRRLRDQQLSVYTCHGPMDPHPEVGTTSAISEALDGRFLAGFLPYKNNTFVGHVVEIPETDTTGLIRQLETLFDLPYVDFEGRHLDSITRVALVAGCGDKSVWMREAESLGAQAYITGEIHCHIDSDYGRQRFAEMMEYVPTTSMSLIGLSHSASEYLVKKSQMRRWIEARFKDVAIKMIPQEKWWL